MSYQQVSTPRFFIDYLQYYRALGLNKATNDPTDTNYLWNLTGESVAAERIANGLIGLNPAFDFRHIGIDNPEYSGWNYMNRLDDSFPVHQMNCIGLLGHNLASAGGTFGYGHYTAGPQGESIYPYNQNTDQTIKINCAGTQSAMTPQYDGFSFSSCGPTNHPTLGLINWGGCIVRGIDGASRTTFEHRLGSQFWGRFYNMPVSPDLKLKMSIDYDGIKQKKTTGGSTLSNAIFTGAPDWGDMPAWALSGDSQWSGHYANTRRMGRRTWDLSFSYLSDSDIFPLIAANTPYEHSDAYGNQTTDGTYHDMTSESQDNFYSQVWSKTMGGHLPFVFQPDKDNDSPDTFAICRFDMKSLKISQSMHRKYNVKLKIRESW